MATEIFQYALNTSSLIELEGSTTRAASSRQSLTVNTHAGAVILDAITCNNLAYIVAAADPAAARSERTFECVAAGHDATGLSARDYVGSITIDQGRFCFLIFDV